MQPKEYYSKAQEQASRNEGYSMLINSYLNEIEENSGEISAHPHKYGPILEKINNIICEARSRLDKEYFELLENTALGKFSKLGIIDIEDIE